MFCPLFYEDDDAFKQYLKGKLEKLEHELVEAHLQALRSLERPAPDRSVHFETNSASADQGQGQSQETNVLERLVAKAHADAQSRPQKKLSFEALLDGESADTEGGRGGSQVSLYQVANTSARTVWAGTLQRDHHHKTSSVWTKGAMIGSQSGVRGGSVLSLVSNDQSQRGLHLRKERGSSSSDDVQIIIDDEENTHADSEEPQGLEFSLRVQWQDGVSHDQKSKHAKNKFAKLVNNMLTVETKSKKKKKLPTLIRGESMEKMGHVKTEMAEWFKDVKCLIHPFSRSWLMWEVCGSALLLHDVVFVPMQVFTMPKTSTLEILKWLTMAYWTLTLFLTFFVTFQRNSEASFVTSHREIIVRYMKGWFLFDLFLVVSDWAGVAMEIMANQSDSTLDNVHMATMARFGRLFRIVRLLRLMRLGGMLQRIENLIDSEYLSICFLIVCNLVAILFLAHMVACLWFGIGDAHASWSWLHAYEIKSVSVGEQYLQSFGWSISTLLGGSLTNAYPETLVEYAFSLIILTIGTIAVSLVFSSTTAAMTRLQQIRAADRDETFKLKRYLRQNKISSNLTGRVLRHVQKAKTLHAQRIAGDKVALLSLLSGPLRLSLQLELHAPHLILHPFFKEYYFTNAGAMGELCLTAVGFVLLSRYDTLFQTFSPATHTFFLVNGVMAYRRAKGAKNTRGTVKVHQTTNICEAALWTCWVHRGSMKALLESQILALDVAAFCDITEAHPDVFLEACEYAVKYSNRMHDLTAEGKMVWDVPSEIMYPERHTVGGAARGSSMELKDFVDVLKEAEDVSAELMDDQSDSDSEDERVLKAALKRGPSINQLKRTKSSNFRKASSA